MDLSNSGPSAALPQLVVITKAPRAGQGKSRLAASLGAEVAAELAAAFLSDTIRGSVSNAWETSVHFTPSDAGAEIRALMPTSAQGVRPPVALVTQSGGDLGERIMGALGPGIQAGRPSVLIGSDTPGLPQRIVAAAFSALETRPLVLGPAADGGFYLVGLHRPAHGLFDDVTWSTGSVLVTVMTNAARRGLDLVLLEEWRDVDDEEALLVLARHLEGDAEQAPETAKVLKRLSYRLQGQLIGAAS